MHLNVTGRKESYKPKTPKGTLRYFRLKRMAWENPSKNELQIGVVCEDGNPTAPMFLWLVPTQSRGPVSEGGNV